SLCSIELLLLQALMASLHKTHNLFLQIQCSVNLQSLLHLQFPTSSAIVSEPSFHGNPQPGVFGQNPQLISSVSVFNRPPHVAPSPPPLACYNIIFYGFKAFVPWKFTGRLAMAQAFAPLGLPTMTDP
ncbi:hypothetical protein AMTR_s00016p00255620, partial [Amborella trichopoda]